MKMKNVTLGLSMIAIAVLFAVGCKKKEPNVEPVADTETESAIDAAWATYVITDIDQICAFMGENQLDQHFYTPDLAVSNSGTISPIRDTTAKALIMGFNKTKCLDGRLREGSVFMYYKKDPISNPHANENSRYYRDFGFVGRISLSEYKVDGWLIRIFDGASPAYVYNRLSTAKYDPTKEKLSWRIAGKFLFIHPTDTSKNIVWDGELIKTLENSTDKDIFAVSKESSINWVRPDLKPKAKAAIISYYGKVSGKTKRTVPFTMTIDQSTPLIRDFLCSADPVSGVSAAVGTNSLLVRKEEHHPFIKGIASFTTGTAEQNIYPRQIYWGNEGSPDLLEQCDNTGEVLIKGVSYRVNFRK
jgi:hypothetical protein